MIKVPTRLKLPKSDALFLVESDGAYYIEDNGVDLLMLESFDEYSGIEVKDGTLKDLWE